MTSARWALLVLSLSSVACGAARASSQRGPKLTVDTPTTLVTQDEAVDVETLLERAQHDLDVGHYEQAAEQFERVANAAQKAHERLRALLGWGTALDLAGQPRLALGVYERYVAEAPEGTLRDEVRVRQVRLLTYLEDYRAAATVAGQVQTEPPALGRIAILASLALDAVAAGREADADVHIGRARSIIEAEQFDRLDPIPRDLAALYFALGQVRGIRARAVVFEPMPKDFTQALETRCQWILDAQAAYSQAMRAADAHWSAMAGVAVGSLYHDLHKELMQMPRPAAADSTERRELFDGALRLRYSILLTKAASMLKATLALAEKDRGRAGWSARAAQTLRDIEAAQAEEERALDALPYSRAQLEQALKDLATRENSKVGQK